MQDRIAILAFMCNLAISSKAIHLHMESCEESLTALRKEKIEVNRQKKTFFEEINNLGDVKDTGSASATPGANGEDFDMDLDPDEPKSVTSHSKDREAARAKQASQKQALAERRRLDEEVNKLERRLEGIEREFRKLLGAVRVKPLGRDRFFNRIWWFDGLGAASLVGSGGNTQYGTGRIFIQGPSEFDMEILNQRVREGIVARRIEEEGEYGVLRSNEWAVYSELDELDEFVAWLNPKGHRDLATKNALTKWWPHITAGMKKRIADANAKAQLPDARRSSRSKAGGVDVSRDPYMQWVNRKAINNS